MDFKEIFDKYQNRTNYSVIVATEVIAWKDAVSMAKELGEAYNKECQRVLIERVNQK